MSISSMTNVAVARRRDTEPADRGPSSVQEVAASTGESPTVASAATSAISAIATYIPTEIVTLYVSVLTVLGVTVPSSALPASGGASLSPSAIASAAPGSGPGSDASAHAAAITPFPAFLFFLVLTPIVVWILYATKVTTAGKPMPRSIAAWPKWEMIAATIAFAVWAAALPSSPLDEFSWFNAGLAGIAVLVTSTLLGLIAPLFTRTPLANS